MILFDDVKGYFNIFLKECAKRRRVYILIAIITLFYLINNFFWLKANTYPSGPDEAAHLNIALTFFKSISGNLANILFSFSSGEGGQWPPLFYISSAIWSLFTGTSYVALVMVNIVYLLILLFSVYFIGRKIFDSPTAMLAVVFISLYPSVFRYSRFFGIDFALTALVCLSVCFLLYTERFKSRKFSVLFGFSLGLGMLTKLVFILFLIGPLVHTLFLSLRDKEYLRHKSVNFILSSIIGILLSLVWYIPNFGDILAKGDIFILDTIAFHTKDINGFNLSLLSRLGNFLKEVPLFISGQISFLFFLLLLLSLFFYFLRRKNRLILVLWYVLPFIFLHFSTHKEARFILPSLPAIALISAAGVQSIFSGKVRYSLYCLILVLALVQFFDVSYSSYGSAYKKDWKIDKIAGSIAGNYIPIPVVGIICEDKYPEEILGREQILDYYLANQDHIEGSQTFGLLEKWGPSQDVLRFLANLSRINYIVYISKNNSWPEIGALSKYLTKSLLKARDWLEYRNGSFLAGLPEYNIDDSFIKESNKRLSEFFLSRDNRFRLLESLELPEGYSAYIYVIKDYLIEEGSLVLSFLKGKAYLWYKDRKLTPRGMQTNFVCNDKSYYSYQAGWECEKIGPNKLKAKGTWEGLPEITQVLEIELNDKQQLIYRIGLKASSEMAVNDINIDVDMPPEYTLYKPLIEAPYFPCLGAVAVKESLALLYSNHQEEILSYFFASENDKGTSTENLLSLVSIPIDKKTIINSSTSVLTDLRISVFADSKVLKEHIKEIEEEYSIIQDDLKLVFFAGKAYLWYKDRKLTPAGITTNFEYDDKVYSSTEAFWQIGKTSVDSLQAKGVWPNLPGISQSLYFERDNDKSFVFKTHFIEEERMDILKKSLVKIELPLTSDYKGWFSVYHRGEFSKEAGGGLF
ncbi:MAG: glycosyltransferase family 39 protein [Candidatus Omnitrophica bacterium]|nr:glycosyltransferase family 39 protein [Candidatus Omnitrophota bacterium]